MSYKTIVSTNILSENIDHSDWVIFDCRSSLTDFEAGFKAYQSGHIPNAIFCNLETDLSSAITNESGRHPLPNFDEFAQKLGDWGVDNQTQVIVYDDMGGALAARLWWQLRTFGHNKVAVLDGGIPQWSKEGRVLSITPPKPSAKTFDTTIDEGAWLTTEQVFQNLKSKKFVILDARTPERYRGESEPIDTVAGRIPNSLNHAFQKNLDTDGLFLSADTLQSQFKAILKHIPNQSPENLVHLCGSGVTACHNMLAMEIASIKGSRLYAGSWSEWIRDPKRPVATA